MMKENEGAVAQLMALSQAQEADARQILAPMLGDIKPMGQRHWSEFPVRSVVAWILLRAGHLAEAVHLAKQSILVNVSDELALHVVGECRLKHYIGATHALHHKRPDMARQYLDASIAAFARLIDVAPERSFLDLLRFVDDAKGPAPPLVKPEGRPTILSLGAWGERYIAAAERMFLPCCLAPGNVPELKRSGTVYLRIHTAEADVDRIHRLPVIAALSDHACIDIRPLPNPVIQGKSLFDGAVWNRMIYAAYTYADLMFARSLAADILFGGGDWLVANKCFSTAKKLLESGYEAVVVQPVRAIADKIRSAVEAAGCRRGPMLDISSEFLYRASLEALHPAILASFMRREPTRLSIDPIQFCFPTPGGFSLRSLQLSIAAASTSRLPPDFECDFHTSDTRLLSDLMVGLDRSKACFVHHHMPGELNYTAVDDPDSLASFGDFELSPTGAVDSIGKWTGRDEDVDHFIWAVQQKFEYPVPPDLDMKLPEDCRPEDQTITEICSLLEARRAWLLGTLNPYRRESTEIGATVAAG